MKRRDFLKKVGIGTAAAAATSVIGAPAVIAQKKYQWKMVTTWPPKLPVLQDGCERLAKRIGELSDGRIQIQVFAAGELVPALESFQAVSDGTVEVGSGASYYWAGKEPATQWFSAVPFGMNAQGYAAWFHGGDGLKLWEEVYAPFNLVPRPGGSTGVQMGGWVRKLINTVDDFKGRIARLAFRKMSGFDLPKNGNNIRDHIHIDARLAAAGGPYAYFLRERSKKLVVKIPAGVREGQNIRLAGQGHEGRAGGTPGDLLLEVRLHRPILDRIKAWVARMLGR